MFKLLKYFSAMVALKDVTTTYEAEKGSPKPVYLRQRTAGAAITAGSVIASIALGFEIDKEAVNQFIDHYNTISETFYQIYQLIDLKMIPAVTGAWGLIMIIKGKYDAKIREKAGKSISSLPDLPASGGAVGDQGPTGQSINPLDALHEPLAPSHRPIKSEHDRIE